MGPVSIERNVQRRARGPECRSVSNRNDVIARRDVTARNDVKARRDVDVIVRPRSLLIEQEHGHGHVIPVMPERPHSLVSEPLLRARPHSLVSDISYHPDVWHDYQTIQIPRTGLDRKSGKDTKSGLKSPDVLSLHGGSGAGANPRLHSDDPSAPNDPSSDLTDPNKGNTVPRDFLYYPPPPPVGAGIGPYRHRASTNPTNPVPNWKTRILPWYKRPQVQKFTSLALNESYAEFLLRYTICLVLS